MSATRTPPPDAQAPVERRCPRCGSGMAPDQEWCLACGAAASTEIAEPRGWRVPILLTGAIVLLLAIGVVLAIVALSGGNEKLAQVTPTPTAALPAPTTTPLPTVTPVPGATVTPVPSATAIPSTTPTPGAGATTGAFAGWPGGSGWTVIIASEPDQAKAEAVATAAQAKGLTVGILHSDDFSSLNPGYYVVFTQKYDTQAAAQSDRDQVKADYADAYVRQVKP